MTEAQQIAKLQAMAESESERSTKYNIIDTLASYGESALPSIFRLLSSEADAAAKGYILDKIKEIKQKK